MISKVSFYTISLAAVTPRRGPLRQRHHEARKLTFPPCSYDGNEKPKENRKTNENQLDFESLIYCIRNVVNNIKTTKKIHKRMNEYLRLLFIH